MLTFGLLEYPIPVDIRDLSLRMDPKFRYPAIGRTHAVDLALPEIELLATHRPLVFDDPARGLYCLASLSDHAITANPDLRLEGLDYVPLALRAFPFGVVAGSDPQQQVIILEKLPEDPSAETGLLDEAVPVFDAPGELSKALDPHWEALKALAVGKARLRTLIEALSEARAFEPWSLSLRFSDRDLVLEGCQIIRPVFWESETYLQLLGHFGVDMARLVHAHRLSLSTLSKSGWARRRVGSAIPGAALDGDPQTTSEKGAAIPIPGEPQQTSDLTFEAQGAADGMNPPEKGSSLVPPDVIQAPSKKAQPLQKPRRKPGATEKPTKDKTKRRPR